MPGPVAAQTSVDERLTSGASRGYNKQTNANAKVRTVTSLGTGFDLLLVRGALGALGVAALWGAVVIGATAAEALTSGRIQVASRIGCPAAVRAWLVGAFVAVFAGVAPAHAGDTGPGSGTPTATLAAAVDGLPLPDRAVGEPRPAPTTHVVRSGDSLWAIARRALPRGASDADVAVAVARLYLTNRSVIGADPDLLRPGQRLTLALPRPTDNGSPKEER